MKSRFIVAVSNVVLEEALIVATSEAVTFSRHKGPVFGIHWKHYSSVNSGSLKIFVTWIDVLRAELKSKRTPERERARFSSWLNSSRFDVGKVASSGRMWSILMMNFNRHGKKMILQTVYRVWPTFWQNHKTPFFIQNNYWPLMTWNSPRKRYGPFHRFILHFSVSKVH